ncbi:phosphatase PAP2 family protein [Candidatus Microgenomates bacterium]|nr:phosphatase PAP2 family protein [Candidatus Microgenomates bacterium]
MKLKLFLLSAFFIVLFTHFSYTVAKENWQRIDFDTTVKVQDHIPKKFDDNFSLLSLLGSVEVTVGFCLIMVALALIRLRWLAVVGWLIIIPASAAEVFGKLILYHPGPPLFFHRTTLATHLPSFYITTEFSYPSGHMTRIVFIATVVFLSFFFSRINLLLKYTILLGILGLIFLMGLTRVSLGEHWLSDVLGGSLLGMAMGFFASGLILPTKKVIT